MTTTDDLLDMTVDEQKEELENLDREELKNLREEENRNTAIDNIDVELGKRPKDSKEQMSKGSEIKASASKVANDQDSYSNQDKIKELERKVDYLIEKCKTTSHEGFENYEN